MVGVWIHSCSMSLLCAITFVNTQLKWQRNSSTETTWYNGTCTDSTTGSFSPAQPSSLTPTNLFQPHATQLYPGLNVSLDASKRLSLLLVTLRIKRAKSLCKRQFLFPILEKLTLQRRWKNSKPLALLSQRKQIGKSWCSLFQKKKKRVWHNRAFCQKKKSCFFPIKEMKLSGHLVDMCPARRACLFQGHWGCQCWSLDAHSHHHSPRKDRISDTRCSWAGKVCPSIHATSVCSQLSKWSLSLEH